MKKILMIGTCLLAVMACQKNGSAPEPKPEETTVYPVRFSPVMTKVTDTQFEKGDAIGVTMLRSDGSKYADNAKMVYDGSVFSGSLMWYAEGTDDAVVTAYHPYSDAGAATFTVQADQSAGTSASDFVAAVKTGVLPSAHAVTLPFKHKLTRIILNVTNNAGGEPSAIILKGAKLTALIAIDDFGAIADDAAAAGSITAHKMSATQYELILPPQEVALIATVVTAAGNELSQALQTATLKAGTQYSISMIVNPADLKVAFSDEISAWEDGGELGADNTLVEKLNQGFITYHEQKYTVAKMQDGKWWMTQNMRYVPEEITVSDDLNKVTAGVFYPLVVNDGTTRAFSKDITVIEKQGYLYQSEVALGLKVGDITSEEQIAALDGAQGICPKGWHVPTKADYAALVGKGVGITTNPDAPYYNGANGSVKMLNDDGFNILACGMVSISDNTATAGKLSFTIYNGESAASMYLGSTMNGTITYKTAGDKTSGIKNFSFSGLMPMTNKANEAEFTCNLTNVGYRIAGPLRCVRNQ